MPTPNIRNAVSTSSNRGTELTTYTADSTNSRISPIRGRKQRLRGYYLLTSTNVVKNNDYASDRPKVFGIPADRSRSFILYRQGVIFWQNPTFNDATGSRLTENDKNISINKSNCNRSLKPLGDMNLAPLHSANEQNPDLAVILGLTSLLAHVQL